MPRPKNNPANRARKHVRVALSKGELTRPDRCELCSLSARAYAQHSGQRTEIVGHHYRGYEPEHQLSVWWICRSCNTLLSGKHDGSLSQAEARALVLESPLTQARLKTARGEAAERPKVEAGERVEPEVLRPVYQRRLF